MSTNRTSSAAPDKPVLEMTDEELRESYRLFFPNGQPRELGQLQHYAGEFEKLSFLKDVPVRYSAHSQVEGWTMPHWGKCP